MHSVQTAGEDALGKGPAETPAAVNMKRIETTRKSFIVGKRPKKGGGELRLGRNLADFIGSVEISICACRYIQWHMKYVCIVAYFVLTCRYNDSGPINSVRFTECRQGLVLPGSMRIE